jgi:hypothetical protein
MEVLLHRRTEANDDSRWTAVSVICHHAGKTGKFTSTLDWAHNPAHPLYSYLLSTVSKAQPILLSGLCTGQWTFDLEINVFWHDLCDEQHPVVVQLQLLENGEPAAPEHLTPQQNELLCSCAQALYCELLRVDGISGFQCHDDSATV